MKLNLAEESESQISRATECRVSEAAHYLGLASLSARLHDTRPQDITAAKKKSTACYSLQAIGGLAVGRKRGNLTPPYSRFQIVIDCYFLLPVSLPRGRWKGKGDYAQECRPGGYKPTNCRKSRAIEDELVCSCVCPRMLSVSYHEDGDEKNLNKKVKSQKHRRNSLGKVKASRFCKKSTEF